MDSPSKRRDVFKIPRCEQGFLRCTTQFAGLPAYCRDSDRDDKQFKAK